MDEQTAAEPTQDEQEPKQASRWEDYIDIFFSPAELYARRARDRVAPPLLTLLALALVFYFVMLPANLMIMRASVGENPDARQALEQFGTLFQVIASVAVPITYLVILAVAALVLWLVGRFADIRTEFSRTMLITTYAGFVYLLAGIAGGIAVLIHGEAGLDVMRHTSFGPLRLLGSAGMSPVMQAILRRFELFTLWQVVLWGIGIAVIYRVSRARAFTVAFVSWLLLTLPSVLWAMLGIGQGPRG